MTALLGRLRALPGVRAAALIAAVPLSGNWGQASYAPDDHPHRIPVEVNKPIGERGNSSPQNGPRP